MPYAHIMLIPEQPVGPSIFWDAIAKAAANIYEPKESAAVSIQYYN